MRIVFKIIPSVRCHNDEKHHGLMNGGREGMPGNVGNQWRGASVVWNVPSMDELAEIYRSLPENNGSLLNRER